MESVAIVVGSRQTVLRNSWTALSDITWKYGLDAGPWKLRETEKDRMAKGHTSRWGLASLTHGWCCQMHFWISRDKCEKGNMESLMEENCGVRPVCLISHVTHWWSKGLICNFFLLTHLYTLSVKTCVKRSPHRCGLIVCIWKASLTTYTVDAPPVTETKATEVTWLDAQQLLSTYL